nr:hypothetical protein [Tanacetum cinerariifolium]
MDDPNITMEKYISLEEEKAQKRGEVFNWKTAKYGKIWFDEDIHDHRSIETKFPAITFNDEVSSKKTLSCKPMVSSLNDEIYFRVFDDFDDEDYTIWHLYHHVSEDTPFLGTSVLSILMRILLTSGRALEDSELKDEALKNKAIMEGLISDNESSNNCWKRWRSHEITYHNHDEIEYENETHDKRQELCEAHKLPMCNIRKFKMIKYSFGQDGEYVAVKEDEYDDFARTGNDAYQTYQEIFRMMDGYKS